MRIRLLILFSSIVVFGACKKKEYRSVFHEWVGNWELENYNYGGFDKPFGGRYTTSFYRHFKNDSFRIMNSYYTRDSVGQDPYLVEKFYHQPAKCVIHSKLKPGNVLSLSEDYTTYDPAGNVSFHWTLWSEIKLEANVYEYGWAYSSSGKPIRQWVYKDGVLSFVEETTYPGSGGGQYYKMTRKFRKK